MLLNGSKQNIYFMLVAPYLKKLVEKTWFLAIMEGIRCVTYSDDGTVLEMFIRLATMEN